MSSTLSLYDEYAQRVYASPFFDLSNFYMPRNFKQFFTWCKYYYTTNGLIAPVVQQMARYPITDLTYGTKENDIRKVYKTIYEDVLDIRAKLIEIGLDYYTYGNAFVSLNLPFKRILICPSCKTRFDADDVKYKFDFKKVKFSGTCSKCKKNVVYMAIDEGERLLKKLRIVRYDPMDIFIKYNPYTGETQYQYRVPKSHISTIKQGDRFIIDKTPLMYLEAISKNSKIIFKEDRIFHFKRSTISGMNMEWGIPLILPALKKAFYLQILQKAQEAIAIQHIIPLTVLFPQANAGESPYEYNLSAWKTSIEEAIKRWKKDPNYVIPLPFPVGIQHLFGEGRRLLVTPEIREAAQQVVAAMGVPYEFLFGGLSWSASSVNLRMLENQFLSYQGLIKRFLAFIRDQITKIVYLPKVSLGMKDFKMIDDVQQKNLLVQLSQLGKLSDEAVLDSLGLDSKEQRELLGEEWRDAFDIDKQKMIEQEKLNGELSILRAQYQAKAQVEMQAAAQTYVPEGATQMGQQATAPGLDMVGHWSSELAQLPPEEQQRVMMQMQSQMPHTADLVQQRSQTMQQQLAPGMTPMPEPTIQPSGVVGQVQGELPSQMPPRGRNRTI